MNIFVTRHGETDWNTYWKLQGRSDTELNQKGREQAELTKKGFDEAGIVFDRVYSSPLKRALETAVLMTGKSETEIIKDDRIIEFSFGKAEGKTPDERNNDPELQNFHFFFDDPEKYVAENDAESFESALSRTLNFWQEEIKPLEKNPEIKNILVVTHGGTMQSLLLNIDGRKLCDYWKVRMSNCTMNKILLEDGEFKIEYTGKVFYSVKDGEDNSAGFINNSLSKESLISLNPIQKEIQKAIEMHKEKALCTEAIIAKKIRDNLHLDGKNKAGLSMNDVEQALAALSVKDLFYSIHLNSANDLLLKKDSKTKYLDQDARRRRLACEKSMVILSNGDVAKNKNNKQKAKKKINRTETRKLNINNYDFD